MITYENNTKVMLDGKHVGDIVKKPEGWQYVPKGHKTGGEYFTSLSKCHASLI